MASKYNIEKLFSVAKQSLYFSGLEENDIWQSCLDYRDRSNQDINQAIINIQNRDQQIKTEQIKKVTQARLQKKYLYFAETKQQEQDMNHAEKLLKTIFKNT